MTFIHQSPETVVVVVGEGRRYHWPIKGGTLCSHKRWTWQGTVAELQARSKNQNRWLPCTKCYGGVSPRW